MLYSPDEIGSAIGKPLGRFVGFLTVVAVQAWIAMHLWEHIAQRLYAQPPIDYTLWILAMWLLRMVMRSAVPMPGKEQ